CTRDLIFLYWSTQISGPRHVGLDDVLPLMDEYDSIEDIYFGKVKESNPAKLTKTRGLYEYIHKLEPPRQPGPHVAYRVIAQQASLFPTGQDRLEKVLA